MKYAMAHEEFAPDARDLTASQTWRNLSTETKDMAEQEMSSEVEAGRGAERYQEGLERLRLSQRLASTGMLGQFACVAETPTEDAHC